MSTEQWQTLIGAIILGNLVTIWKIISTSFKYYKEYLDMQTSVSKLTEKMEKFEKDLNGIGRKIRNEQK